MGCIKKPDVVIRGDKLESWHKHAGEGKQFDMKKKNEKEKKNFNSKEISWHSNTTKKKEGEFSK